MKSRLLACCLAVITGCGNAQPPQQSAMTNVRKIEIVKFDDRLDELLPAVREADVVISGLQWAEGPVWIGDAQEGFLLASDVPGNRIHQWSRADGAGIFLEPSGVASTPGDGFREPGANGLFPDDAPGKILVANHGLRAVARLDLETKAYDVLADSYAGEPFNSPNDLVRATDGTIYFTDPPYGLEGVNDSPMKKQLQNGVYRINPSGDVELIIADLIFPNGVALSPDEKTLYIGNSDTARPILLRYDLTAADIQATGQVIHNGASDMAAGKPGLPDGLAVDKAGNLFATAPGGVHIFAPDGTRLGVIDTGSANANCAIGEGGGVLYIAAHTEILRIPLRQPNAP